MKELYSFHVERKIEKEVPHVKKTKDGPVETTKKVTESVKTRIVFSKPSLTQLEDAEFFYGQKFNEYINAGFLTKAMLSKKMSEIGGISHENIEKELEKVLNENIEASRVIEFFEGAKDLNESQKAELKEARDTFVTSRAALHNYETNLRSQFSQTADAKAEIKVIEWLVLNFSFFEEEVEDDKKLFHIFEGDSYDEKRSYLISLQESEEEEITDPIDLRNLRLHNDSFEKLIQVASLWYNKIAENQEDIDKALKDIFEEESSDEEPKE